MRVLVNLGLIMGFVIAAPTLGLFTSAGLYMAAHMLYLGIRPLWLSLVVAVGATLVMYGFFGIVLGVEMPGALLL